MIRPGFGALLVRLPPPPRRVFGGEGEINGVAYLRAVKFMSSKRPLILLQLVSATLSLTTASLPPLGHSDMRETARSCRRASQRDEKWRAQSRGEARCERQLEGTTVRGDGLSDKGWRRGVQIGDGSWSESGTGGGYAGGG